MKTKKVHKITIMVIDHDDLGADGVTQVIENARYPNHCIGPSVMDTETREVEWSDDHPLNLTTTSAQAFEQLFEFSAPRRGPIQQWLARQKLPSRYVAVTRTPPFKIVDHDDNMEALSDRTEGRIEALYYHQRTDFWSAPASATTPDALAQLDLDRPITEEERARFRARYEESKKKAAKVRRAFRRVRVRCRRCGR